MATKKKQPPMTSLDLDDLDTYLATCRMVKKDLDVEGARQLARAALRYYSGDDLAREQLRPLQELENRWYASLKAGRPDYGVYADEFFLPEAWACWRVYSRKYLAELARPRQVKAGRKWTSAVEALAGVGSIVDLGCGCGHTTAALKKLWPSAGVLGTNIGGTAQIAVARRLGHRHGFAVTSLKVRSILPADLVFASEYFEHHEDPIAHLRDVLKRIRPRYLVIANSFSARSVGHFPAYLVPGGAPVANTKIGRLFNEALRTAGYHQVETKFWNKRPTIWSCT